jgi:hypothetical protein
VAIVPVEAVVEMDVAGAAEVAAEARVVAILVVSAGGNVVCLMIFQRI